ncbi:hypothetical protein C8R44DRAFT_781643 [Mycena epipterygia]|nr:hypothetical protein C8R44DRAFT_781643 [Mycena epipterygia]
MATPLAPTIPLTPTFGQLLLALFIQAILYGMGLLQVYLYFLWYHKDGWGVKAAVIAMVIVETFQMATMFDLVYIYFIDDFGNFSNLVEYNWQVSATLSGVYASTFVSQVYFANCIYRLHPRNKIVPSIVFFLALGCLGAGISQLIHKITIAGFLNLTETTVTIQAVLALLCDSLITASLCWRLNKERTGIQSTNILLNHLILTAINRGALTTLSATFNIIMFFTELGTLYFMFWIFLSGKLYMNSMLATLNTRQHAMKILGNTMTDHVSLIAFNATNTGEVEINTRSVGRDDIQDGKLP